MSRPQVTPLMTIIEQDGELRNMGTLMPDEQAQACGGRTIPVEEVEVGDTILLVTGEVVVVDELALAPDGVGAISGKDAVGDRASNWILPGTPMIRLDPSAALAFAFVRYYERPSAAAYVRLQAAMLAFQTHANSR